MAESVCRASVRALESVMAGAKPRVMRRLRPSTLPEQRKGRWE